MSVVAALIVAWWIETVWQSAPHASLFLCAGDVQRVVWRNQTRSGRHGTLPSDFRLFLRASIHSLAVDITQLPRLIVFALSALLVGSLSAAQRRGRNRSDARATSSGHARQASENQRVVERRERRAHADGGERCASRPISSISRTTPSSSET